VSRTIDLTPFGFTPTESVAYAALLRLGPTTGYQVGRSARLARANAYAALEGLVHNGAASRTGGRPRRYRPTDPATLLARLATRQAEQLDALGRALEGSALPPEPGIRELRGLRPTANAITQLVARAERRVDGVVVAALWAPTLPAWRSAALRARLSIVVAGEAAGTEGLAQGRAPDDASTLLVIDEAHVVVVEQQGPELAGLWICHPLLARVALRAIEALE
jgi:sugar-specific transcriptional regulator TrmB